MKEAVSFNRYDMTLFAQETNALFSVSSPFRQWDLSAGHGAEAAADGVHTTPNTGAGEGVPLQPLPDPAEKDRDRARAVPDGAADQDLVPEPEDEVEEGAQDGLDERHAHAPDAPGARLPAPLAPAGHGHAPVRRPGAHAPRRGGQGAVR